MKPLVERMLYITLLLVFIIAGVFAYLAINATNRFNKQQQILQSQVEGQKEVLQGIQDVLQNQGKTTTDINRSMSCILTFFARPDRVNYFISDLTTCTITNIVTGSTEVLPLPKAPKASSQQSGKTSTEKPTTPQAPQKPSSPAQPAPAPDNRSAVEHVLDDTTNFTCSIIRVLCKQ